MRKKESGLIYAMKVMKKEVVIARDQADYMRAERDILTVIHHPYVVTMRQGLTLVHFSAHAKPFWSVSRVVSSL